MKVFFTKEQKWLSQWDAFMIANDRGSHLQLSDWLQSYQSYGFDFELCLCVENEKIIGGFGAVVAKVSLFKFYIISYGPIVLNDNSNLLNDLIEKVSDRAKAIKACYCQINLPFSDNVHVLNHLYQESGTLESLAHYEKGHLFKFVFSLNGFNWINLRPYTDTESLLLDFKSSVRRDIRSSNRKELYVKELKNEEEIKEAYGLCLANASKANYAIRDWEGFSVTLLQLIQKGSAKFIAAHKEKEIKGAILLIKSGNFYTYILGGTKKEKPDLLVGHFLQWEALKLSFAENCEGYNISLGGSKGVQEFKNSFNSEAILFENAKYHKVIHPFLFAVFLFFEKYMKPYKKSIARLLSMIKNKK